MRSTCLLLSTALLLASPVRVSAQPTATAAESTLPHSRVSVMVEPALSDGRMVVRLAAKNLTAAPVPFGPSGVSIAKPNGEAIALYPLQSLINDVRAAAGMVVDRPSASASTQGAHAAPQLGTRDGRVDVSGYTGGAAVGRDEYIRRNQAPRKVKPTISEAEAQNQIAALNRAILDETNVPPGQIAAGQIVSDKLKLGKDRTLHLRIRIAGDEHGFTILAPNGG